VKRSLRINDQVWDVLLEEKPLACYEGRRTKFWFGESSNSALLSGTFVEETVFSNRSCEEEIKPVIRKELCSKGVEGSGKAEEGGERCANKTKIPFKVSIIKDNSGQEIGCTSSTKEERLIQVACQGVDLDINPDQGRNSLCSSHNVHAELAKVVVEIESVFSRVAPTPSVGQVEAHCHMVRSPCVTQIEKRGVGLYTMQEEARCVAANGNSNMGSISGGKQVEEYGAVRTEVCQKWVKESRDGD